jgi:ornithine cyclodeaminase/alanine dehydrogenase-like protein (mu-crystallin family)
MMKSINVPVYSAEDIDIILSQIDVVETMRQAFLNLAHGQAAQPDQKVIMFPNQGGIVLVISESILPRKFSVLRCLHTS